MTRAIGGWVMAVMSGRHRVGLILLALAGLVLTSYVGLQLPMLTREPVGPPERALPPTVEGGRKGRQGIKFGHFNGHSEASIVERFGPPSRRWSGHFGDPQIYFQLKYADAITTTYVRPSGTLYLSFCDDRGEQVCFWSAWMPIGTEF